jgi:hypothetical protein
MSQENTTNKQPLIRYINRQQMRRWVAYTSDESGRREIYVRPLENEPSAK